jgi:hypothetical protein
MNKGVNRGLLTGRSLRENSYKYDQRVKNRVMINKVIILGRVQIHGYCTY